MTIRRGRHARRPALRLAGALVAAVVPLTVGPATPPTPAAPVSAGPAGIPFDPAPMAGRCGDPAGSWLATDWRTEVRWQLNEATVPQYLAEQPGGVAGVAAAIRSAAEAVATGRNDCGLPADLTLGQRYTGGTGRTAGVNHDGSCGTRDRHNVVSFGRLDAGLLAVTCIWWDGRPGASRSVEADILVDGSGGAFFLDQPQECQARWDLEGIATHEFGHVFGLGHVSSAEHGSLTMSDGVPECSTAYRGLGLGDYLTLHGNTAIG